MTKGRLDKATHPALYAAIAALTLGVFVGDLFTRVGIALWVCYIVPLVLCMYVRRSSTPVWVALASVVFIAIDYARAYLQGDPTIVSLGIMPLINRIMGAAVIATVAWQTRAIILSQRRGRERMWLSAAEAQLAQECRGEMSLARVSERMLVFVANYVDAQVGALYVAEGERWVRKAGYGLSDAAGKDSFLRGEGLVGKAAQRGKPSRITDLPEDYLKVTSGLGSRKASTLLFGPATADGEVIGLIELGFFQPTYELDLELLQEISELAGIALRTALLRSHREQLLQETQRQAEELQVQQEELRVANEELEEHATALKDSQSRLENQQAELEQINVQLEERSQLLARQNDHLARAQKDLGEKAGELERASQYKSEFLANMSHELRTPLNSSLILAKLLADNKHGNLSEEQVRFARTIYSSGNDLLELINDILDLSKVETGNVEVRRDNIVLEDIADNVLQSIRPMAQQKKIDCRLSVDPGAPSILVTDGQRLRQILKNLLSNAVKFTEHGEVSLHLSPAPNGGATLSVRDTGIGIADHQQQIIFEPFRQADGTTNRRYGGTGLGLSISRELAHFLGGRIELSSRVGVGSTFTLHLPSAPPESVEKKPLSAAFAPKSVDVATASPAATQAPAPAASAAPMPKLRAASSAVPDDRGQISESGRLLLVVEDDAAFARIIYDLAQQSGFQCLIAGTADEGVDLALQYRPTAIVLDMKLPDHSGLSVLDRLKHNSMTRHIPVQVVSSIDYTQAALQMGAAGVMLKPVQLDELAEALGKLESKSTAAQRTVLVVEDNLVQRESIVHLLAADDVRIVPVDTAAAALKELAHATFDCMVLDLSLPDATGYELLERMAHGEQYSFPPVIVYTGRSLSTQEEQQLRRYSTSIIIKGAKSPERLLDEVTLFLHQVESSLPPDRQRMLREARNRETVFEGRKILIVEDDVRNIFALSQIIEPCGATLQIARNGREAVEAVRPGTDIDLVLMDIMMPEMDGLEAMRRIRAQPELGKLPIIALTAKAMPDDQKRCLDAGANDYITKPIDVDKLLSLIRIWLPK